MHRQDNLYKGLFVFIHDNILWALLQDYWEHHCEAKQNTVTYVVFMYLVLAAHYHSYT